MQAAQLMFSYPYNKTNNAIYKANIGEGLPKHEHTFAHTTVCVQGKIIVRKENKEIIISERENPLLLTENEWHEIEALEDNTIFINQFSVGMEE
jgi:quercetin dioxygenase-like cupin family protein